MRGTGKKLVFYTFLSLGVFSAVFVPVAEAGFFSFLDKVLGTDFDIQIKTEIVKNSQTASLLQPVLNFNPAAGQGGGGISVVNHNALLSETGPVGSLVDIEERVANADRISIYVVREGDSLSQIAQMFNVSVNTIIWANDIKRGDLIQAGQVLIILPVSGLNYIVKKGDTVSSIAKKFKADAEEIIRFNGLSLSGALAVGNEIIIPDGEAPYVAAPQYANTKVKGSGGPVYSGYYLKPIEGGVKSQGLHGYNAVDLATYCGAPIFAAASGDVLISRSYGWNGGYGNYVVIAHDNGTQTLYAHNSQNIVSAGWYVVKGQVVGYIGSTGKSTGCHVHFEVRGATNPF